MVFPVVMYGCESWTINKAERRRIDAFELWCWRRLLRVPWTARRANQPILKEISPGCSLEGLMLKLRYFGHLMEELTRWKRSWCRQRLKAGEEDDRGWDGWMVSLTQWTWVCTSSWSWWRTGKPGVLESMGLQRVGHDWATEQQQQMVCSCQAPLSMGFHRQGHWNGFVISFSRGSSRSRDRACISCISCINRKILHPWATREAPCPVVFDWILWIICCQHSGFVIFLWRGVGFYFNR